MPYEAPWPRAFLTPITTATTTAAATATTTAAAAAAAATATTTALAAFKSGSSNQHKVHPDHAGRSCGSEPAGEFVGSV